MARSSKASKSIEGNVLTVEFNSDSVDNLAVDLTSLPSEIQTQLALHGLSQKIGDSYAGVETVEEAAAAAKGTLEALQNGTWSAGRSGGSSGPRITDLARAVAELKGIEVEAAVETISSLDDDRRKALRNNPQVKAKLAEISAKRARDKAKAAQSEAKGSEGSLDDVLG